MTFSIQEIDIDEPINNIQQADGLKENVILEMAEQLKNKYDEICKLEKKIKNKNRRFQIHIFKSFGLMKAIERMSAECMEVPNEIQNIIDLLVDINDEFIDDQILSLDN